MDFYGNINMVYVSRDKMKYIGTNKFLRNIIYASVGQDKHLYINGNGSQFLHLKRLRMSAIFEDFDEAALLLCNADGDDTSCDPLDADFPIRDYLVPTLIEMIVKEITGSAYKPVDKSNDADDNLADIIAFLRRNMKSGMQRQIEGQ